MNQKKKIQMAIIGLGAIAEKAYLPIVCNHPKIDPILCSRNPETLKRLALQYRIKETYTNIEELIKNKPDAAMVHSATQSHFSIIKKLLTAGIPVFVDKPLSYTLNEVEELLELSAKNHLLLYVGFNRRFAPLISQLTSHIPNQVLWQKNRVNLPGDPRIFVFDDFIHVIDGLRFLAGGSASNLSVFPKMEKGKLQALNVTWKYKDTWVYGGMNRISGITEERIEYYAEGYKWQIDELVSGTQYQNEKQLPITFDNWESTLYKRGFVAMIDDWINTLSPRKFDKKRNDDIWQTHLLCEQIVAEIVIG
ncbi:MAG: Gfo/Idh/MocA family oxidoreductase [Flavobacteriaceae bacterium]